MRNHPGNALAERASSQKKDSDKLLNQEVYVMKSYLSSVLLAAALGVVLLAISVPATAEKSKSLDLSTVKAPVAPDGTTAGAPTDFVITFRDPNPDVKGISLRKGATVEVVLPDEFTFTGAGPNFGVILQGWPQSPPAPPPDFLWTSTIDGNTLTLTLTSDFKAGQFGPGPKQVHLILLGFANPVLPGVYPIELSIRKKPNKKKKHSGTGYVRIIPDARPSVEPISLFSAPPGPPPPFFNPLYQDLALGEPARQLGLYLWDANLAPFLGVDLSPTGSPSYYQLTQDGSVVGEVFITAPASATSYTLASVPLPPGGPPSVNIPAFVTGVDVGLLGIQFTPDPSVAGNYEIAISMIGGNEKSLFVSVGQDDDDDDDDGDNDDEN